MCGDLEVMGRVYRLKKRCLFEIQVGSLLSAECGWQRLNIEKYKVKHMIKVNLLNRIYTMGNICTAIKTKSLYMRRD